MSLTLLLPSSDTRQLADHGGPAAGGAALRFESNHWVHDRLKRWFRRPAGTERP